MSWLEPPSLFSTTQVAVASRNYNNEHSYSAAPVHDKSLLGC